MLLGARLAYGIRALCELALLPGQRGSVAGLAEKCGISEVTLRRILRGLQARGYLQAQKGRGGGVRLAKDPQEIKIVDILNALEKDWTLALIPKRGELLPPDPVASPFWTELERRFQEELAKLTLADVLALAKGSAPPKPRKTKARKKRRARR